MATPHTIITIPDERRSEEAAVAAHETTSSSWVPSWFPGSPLRATPHEKASTSKSTQMELEEPVGAGSSLLKTHLVIAEEEEVGGASAVEQFPMKERPSSSRQEGSSGREAPAQPRVVAQKSEEQRRKSRAAPPVPQHRTGALQTIFSYDTLKERADTWKKERSKRPTPMLPERQDSFVEKVPDLSRKHIEFMEDTNRPKIRFTQEESDKVDKDILRLMGALDHNKYPFNRDKHLLFNKLRLIRRKQMGLLFAHRELDGTGYFDTDRDEFGYDFISDQLGTMYNVMDAISRDVYELRELLYYERKDQTPPTRRGSSDRRASSEAPPTVKITKPISFPTRAVNAPLSSYDGIDGEVISAAPTLLVASVPKSASSPTRPILKHSVSAESFKSAKSDDTVKE